LVFVLFIIFSFYFGQGRLVCHFRGRRKRTFVSSPQVSRSSGEMR
jgi:hypothetical protein